MYFLSHRVPLVEGLPSGFSRLPVEEQMLQYKNPLSWVVEGVVHVFRGHARYYISRWKGRLFPSFQWLIIGEYCWDILL